MPVEKTIIITKEEGKAYDPLPENIYQVELLDVSSKKAETYDSRTSNSAVKEFETNLVFQYTLLAGKNKEGESLRGRNVWDNFVSASLYIGKNGKNKLYKIVEALLNRDLTEEEEANGIDGDFLNELVGKQMRIGTKNKASKKTDAVYTNADTYYPSENDLNSLTEEERDLATVKNKKEDDDFEKSGDEGIDEDSIPF